MREFLAQTGEDEMRSSSGFGGRDDDGALQEKMDMLETERYMQFMKVADLSNAIKAHEGIAESIKREVLKVIED